MVLVRPDDSVNGAGNSQQRVLQSWLLEDCPRVASLLFPLCLSDSGEAVLCFDHPKLAMSCFGAELFSPQVAADLHSGYVYLSAYYFGLDSVVDGHPRPAYPDYPLTSLSSYLGQLLLLAQRRLFAALGGSSKCSPEVFHLLLMEELNNASAALADESVYRAAATIPNTVEEFSCIVNRASSFIFLFKYLSRLAGHAMPSDLLTTIEKFLFFMQLGDDLGDWREDLRSGRYTSFLRQAFSEIGGGSSESLVETWVYLDGGYERRLALIVDGLSDAVDSLCHNPQWLALKNYVEAQKLQAIRGLQEFQQIKTRS